MSGVTLQRKPRSELKLKPRRILALNERGYHVVYHGDRVNHCPGCGRSSWYIGRSTAECSFCGTAIPLRLT